MLCCFHRHAGITTEQALAALQQAGAALGEGEDDGGPAAGTSAAADAGDDLPEEDKAAMQQFLKQRSTILRRVRSDGESSEEDQDNEAVKANGQGTANTSGPPVDGASHQPAAAAAGKPKQPAIKVAVRAKRAAAAAPVDDAKKHKSAAAGQAPKEVVPGRVAGASLLGLVGDYGSSSGSEDNT